MRPTLRAAGLLALVVVAITCADAPTAPAGSEGSRATARIGLAPSFSADAARAYRGLVDFGFDIASARVRLTAADGVVAKDTVIAFPSTQDTLRMDLSVPMDASEQTFTALIELRDANGVVLFTGVRSIIARASSLPGGAPPVIPLEYSGPGHSARALSIVPGDGAHTATDVVALTAAGVDSSGGPVADLFVRWTSSDTTLGTLTSRGPATAELRGAGKRGTVVITAVSPLGLTSSTRLALVPPVTRLVVIGGDAQTGVAGHSLAQPFVVELQATDGLPVANAGVTFRAVTAGGVVATSTSTTDATGRASSTITLGKSAGAYLFEAASSGLSPASITATATPAPAAALSIVSGDAQTDSVGLALAQPLVVRVVDEFGIAVSGASVDWTLLAGAGKLSAARTTSDTDGLASVSYTLGRTPRVDSVLAQLTGIGGAATSVVFTARTISRAPTSIEIQSGGGQQGVVSTTLPAPLVARVSDALGNPVAGVTVTWGAQGISAVAFVPAQSVTDATGLASTTVTLPSGVEVVTAVSSVGALRATTQLSAVAGNASTFTLLQPLPSSVLVDVPPANPLRIQLADAAGNPVRVAGIKATAVATLSHGRSKPAPVTATSDSVGIITFNLPAYVGAAGSATITISAPGFTPLVTPAISFVTGPLALLEIITQPSLAATSGMQLPVQPAVRLEDAGGNPIAVAGVKITAYVASGGGTLGGTITVDTDATGLATFTDLSITASAGQKTLGFKSGSLPDVLSDQISLAP